MSTSPLRFLKAGTVRAKIDGAMCPPKDGGVDYTASPAEGFKEEIITFYEMVGNKYKKLISQPVVDHLLNKPVIMKINDVYYAGNDEAWEKLDGKKRKWAHDWVEVRYRKIVEAGLPWEKVRKFTVDFLEKNLLLLKHFPGAEFTKDTSCQNKTDSPSTKASSIDAYCSNLPKLNFGQREDLMKIQSKISNLKAQFKKTKK